MQGSELRDARKVLGLNQTDLAQALGMDMTTISRWERDRPSPTPLAELALEALLRRAIDVRYGYPLAEDLQAGRNLIQATIGLLLLAQGPSSHAEGEHRVASL